MEITKQQIIDALKKNPEYMSGVLPTIEESEVFKNMFANKTKVELQKGIDEATRKNHERYDQQLEKAGFKAKPKGDGKLEKSYEVLDRFIEDYNESKETISNFDSDSRIAELKAANAKLIESSDGPFKKKYEDLKSSALQKEQDLMAKMNEMKGSSSDFKKSIAIKNAITKLKMNPDISEVMKKMVLNNAEQQLLSNSKFDENGKLIFVDSEGKEINNANYEPKTAEEMLLGLAEIKEITLDSTPGGGGADIKIKGSVETKKVEGKDIKRLNLDGVVFKDQEDFIEIAEQKMLDSGITIEDEEWSSLKNQAFTEYKIEDLTA